MKIINQDDFLINIRQKIKRKKQQHFAGVSLLLFCFSALIGFQSTFLIMDSRYEKIWVENEQQNTEWYSWELNNDLEDDLFVDFILDEMDWIEIFQELSYSPESRKILSELNLGG